MIIHQTRRSPVASGLLNWLLAILRPAPLCDLGAIALVLSIATAASLLHVKTFAVPFPASLIAAVAAYVVLAAAYVVLAAAFAFTAAIRKLRIRMGRRAP